MFTEKDFKGAKVVVTGAANGIGKGFARNVAKRGADVLIADIHGDEAEAVAKAIAEEFGVKTYSIQADVSLKAECQKIFDKAMEVFDGHVDVLINNAGVTALGDVWNIPERDIKWVYETNVYSHWFMMGLFIPQMEKQGNHCQIINVCSIAGLLNSPSAPAYFSSKHAAVSLSEVVARQLKAKEGNKIDISVFTPGFVQTEMYLTDRHRPERFAMTDEPYYSSEFYKQCCAMNKYVLDNGRELEPTLDYVFEMLGKGYFYLLTHDEYDPFLRVQGKVIADKVRPPELSDANVDAQFKAEEE